MEPYAELIGGYRYFPLGIGVLALGGAVATIPAELEDDSGRERWVGVGMFTAVSALSFANYVVPETYRSTLFESISPALLIAMGATFYASSRNTDATRWTFGSLVATGVAMEGVILLDSQLLEPTNYFQLNRDFQRINTDATTLTVSDLRTMERHLSLTRRPIPRWVPHAVMILGSLVAAGPVFFSRDKDDRAEAGVFGGICTMVGTIGLLGSSVAENRGYRAYVKALQRVQMAPLGPNGSAGMSLAVRF